MFLKKYWKFKFIYIKVKMINNAQTGSNGDSIILIPSYAELLWKVVKKFYSQGNPKSSK